MFTKQSLCKDITNTSFGCCYLRDLTGIQSYSPFSAYPHVVMPLDIIAKFLGNSLADLPHRSFDSYFACQLHDQDDMLDILLLDYLLLICCPVLAEHLPSNASDSESSYSKLWHFLGSFTLACLFKIWFLFLPFFLSWISLLSFLLFRF